MTFRPCYVWPNPAFPFRLYFDSAKIRIFIIENIFHNYNWLKGYSSGIRDTDYFFVILGWHHSEWHAQHSLQCIEDCGLSTERFIILCNSHADYAIFADYGFKCHVVNQNCFLDYNLFKPNLSVAKEYDAVYVARLTPFKRHELASEVKNLALVSGDLHGGDSGAIIPPHIFRNSAQLTPAEVQDVICKSRTGLILSEVEGACFASSEYLLCGIPVVSTFSHGGRDVWYNDYNSIQCNSTSKAVSDAVKKLVDKPLSPVKIRNQHIHLSNHFRREFVGIMASLFRLHDVLVDAEVYFESNYFHKMRHSENPNFDHIFPKP